MFRLIRTRHTSPIMACHILTRRVSCLVAHRAQKAAVSPLRSFAVSAAARAPPLPFATIPTCPSPTCDCAPTPALPDGLPIDHQGKLNGLISSYAEQVLICTAKDDWPSRIEDDNSGDNLAADLKELFGRGGVYSDVSRRGHSGSHCALICASLVCMCVAAS